MSGINTIIQKELEKGKKHIDIAKGIYYLELTGGKPISFQNLSGITIDFHNSEIICKRPSQAFEILHCSHVVFKNLSIDYDPLPFTEGEIIDIDTAQRMWLKVKLFEGYSAENIENNLPDRFQVFDRENLQLKKNLFTYWQTDFSKVKQVSNRTFTFYKSRLIKESSEAIGDKIVFSLPEEKAIRPHCIVLYQSNNISFQNVTLYASNCFGFFEDECSKNSYSYCRVIKKLVDKNKSFPRLRSANADAFHSKSAIVGPLVEHCEFTFNGDDDIAINSRFYSVTSADKNNIYVSTDEENVKIATGDTLCFVDANGSIIGEAKAISINTHPDSLPQQKALITPDKQIRNRRSVKIILDKPINISSGALVYSLSRAGSGFIVRNNRVGFTRARGILIKASNGVVEDNTAVGCELAGIVLAPELSWMEAGFSRNVTIKHNLVRDCMFVNSSYRIEQAAPISIVAVNSEKKLAPAGGFRNIKIIDNKIENSPLPAIIITSAKNVLVSDNQITQSRNVVRSHGKIIGTDNTHAIWASDTSHVKILRNAFSHHP